MPTHFERERETTITTNNNNTKMGFFTELFGFKYENTKHLYTFNFLSLY